MFKALAAAGGTIILEGFLIWRLWKSLRTAQREARTADKRLAEAKGKIARQERIMARIGEIEKERRKRNEEIDAADGHDIASILSNWPEDSGD